MLSISADLQNHIINYGMMLSSILMIVYFFSFKVDAEIWRFELTGGREKGNQKGYWIWFIIHFSITCTLMFIASANLWKQSTEVNQSTLFVLNIFIYAIYALVDLLVVDLIIYMRLKPPFMALEGLGINKDLLHHAKGFFIHMIYGSVFAFLVSLFFLGK